MCLVVKLKSNAVKHNIEKDCNVKFMNQNKLDTVKQRMARLKAETPTFGHLM